MRNNLTKIIAFSIPLILLSLMLQYIYDLEKNNCECSISDDRILLGELIKYYMGGVLVILILSLTNNVTALFIKNVLALVNLLVFGYLSLIFFRYNSKLTEIACECAVDNRRTAFKYYLYFHYTMLVIFTLIIYYMHAVIEASQSGKSVSIKKL